MILSLIEDILGCSDELDFDSEDIEDLLSKETGQISPKPSRRVLEESKRKDARE